MRSWKQKSLQSENKNCISSFQIGVKNVLDLEDTNRYELIMTNFPNSCDEIFCTCAEEEKYSDYEGFYILEDIPADANLDDNMW